MIRRLLPLLLLSILACTPPPPLQPATVPAPPSLKATAVARRVVLLSFDGLGADALAQQQNLPAFERIAREGAAARVINVDPTLTGPTHVSILTGADPQRTGVVSNRFHLEGTPREQIAMGVRTDSDVETLVEAARRQGKRVGVVSFPTIDNATPRRTADFGLGWTYPAAEAKMVKLTSADFRREWVPPSWTDRPQRRRSYSPIMRARTEWNVPRVFRIDVDIVAYDTTDDGRTNYDSYLVESEEREIPIDERGWFALAHTSANGVYGSWSKILEGTDALDLTIYRGPVSRSNAWPASFREMLDTEAGFWPGGPDEDGLVDATTFIEQMERLAGFYRRAQTLTIGRMQFDLLLLYQPQVDQASHNFLGAPEGDRVIRRAFELADGGLNAVAEALETDDALVVTSDHGLLVTDREIRLNRLLADRGFAPRWRAYMSGAFAHLYRFEGPDDSNAVIELLNSTGGFERIEKKSPASHRNSGDIIAWGYPNVHMSTSEEAPAVGPRPPGGQHGALNSNRGLHAVLFAYGAGVMPGPLGEIRQTQIARFVSELLGIAPPQAAE
ncbi:MAG TPA: alkaline phosphatase family protein [Thermoanaerobaculia bacterium]|nr:alkaline phosphatase family protein [Thermoanaerobaculia bacterium]